MQKQPDALHKNDLEPKTESAGIASGSEWPLKQSSQQAIRSERTLEALLKAAAQVFARDGFAAARIEDIAAAAGRSRGAFYANFKSKSELFLALRSQSARRKAVEVRELLRPLAGNAERSAAIQRYILEQICDSETLLLQIEFKLFAQRHPEMLADLAEKHLEATIRVNREELPHMFPGDTEAKDMRKTLAVEALLEGFALNALFSPGVLTPAYLEELVPRLLEEILPQASMTPE